MLIRRGFDSNLLQVHLQRGGKILFHRLEMSGKLRLLGNQCRIDIYDSSAPRRHLALSFLQKHATGSIAPTRIGVRKKMADISLSQGAQERIANRVHERVSI